MVTGPGSVVGDEVASSKGTHAIGFIGSVATGEKVATSAAGKAMVLELGGNGPLVVLEDADVAGAASASIAASFLCAGQSCTAGELFLVHESVHDEFVDRLRIAIDQTVRFGDPFAEETTMGPLNNEATARKMDEHVADALERGASVVTGAIGQPDSRPTSTGSPRCSRTSPTRWRWPATRRSGRSSRSSRSRATTRPFKSPMLRSTASSRRSGRATSHEVFASPKPSTRAGSNINESTNYWESHLPFGGRAGTSSGVGRVGGSSVLEAFTEPKTVVFTLE